jgi:hypothetical protein
MVSQDPRTLSKFSYVMRLVAKANARVTARGRPKSHAFIADHENTKIK